MPGDVMVGDSNGVLVVPAQLAEEVALDALEQEEREAWALERVRAGESVRGVYPLSEARRGDYEAWREARAAGGAGAAGMAGARSGRRPRSAHQRSAGSRDRQEKREQGGAQGHEPICREHELHSGVDRSPGNALPGRRGARCRGRCCAGRLAAVARYTCHLGRRFDRGAHVPDGGRAGGRHASRLEGDRRPGSFSTRNGDRDHVRDARANGRGRAPRRRGRPHRDAVLQQGTARRLVQLVFADRERVPGPADHRLQRPGSGGCGDRPGDRSAAAACPRQHRRDQGDNAAISSTFLTCWTSAVATSSRFPGSSCCATPCSCSVDGAT